MKVVCIMGKSGSGKSTLEKALENEGYSRVISYTTREKRPGEKNHETYEFISRAAFHSLMLQGKMIEHTIYSGNYYGAPLIDGDNTHIIVVEPNGYSQIKKKLGYNALGIYLEASDEVLRNRMAKRGDSEDSINSRIRFDTERFASAGVVCDVIVPADESEQQVFEAVLKAIKAWEKY